MKYDYDIIIIGGGATGLGCAVEAVSRGYKTLLLEGNDFGKGTSSKSTKLIHGGIRYLANLDFALVKEGLEERYYFLKNAPHLTKKQTYLIPMQNIFDKVKYVIGVLLYDFLSGRLSIGRSKVLNKAQTIAEAKDFTNHIINGGAIYLDGQFDDTRLLVALMKTAEQLGGKLLNYHKVTRLEEVGGKLKFVHGCNQLTDEKFCYSAKFIINATGTFSDSILDLAEPELPHNRVSSAQGTHLVFDKHFFDTSHAILIPKTIDNRVLFILPWHDKIVVGTTDIKVDQPSLEPIAMPEEIDFIIDTFNQYSTNKVSHSDIKSIFCGQRPLVKSSNTKNTAKISRKHEINSTKNGLITIAGGKWTIYRRMGQDTIDYIEKIDQIPKTNSITKELKLFGYTNEQLSYPLSSYGNQHHKIAMIQKEYNNYDRLHNDLPYYQAEVIYHVREEHACTVEDILLRRTRAMFIDAKAANESALLVATLMARELDKSQEWINQQVMEIQSIANNYIYK